MSRSKLLSIEKYPQAICGKCKLKIKDSHFIAIGISRVDDWEASSWYCLKCANSFCETLQNTLKEFEYIEIV